MPDAFPQLFERLRAVQGVVVTDRDASWDVEIRKDAGLVFEVTIPKGVLEWFVSAKKDGREVWRDWTEHYATAGESRSQLEAEMIRDVGDFIHRLMASTVTASVFADGSATVLWERPEGQKHVTLYEERG